MTGSENVPAVPNMPVPEFRSFPCTPPIAAGRSRFGMLSADEVQFTDTYCSPLPDGIMQVLGDPITPAHWALARAQALIENLSPSNRQRVERGMAKYDAEHGTDL